MIPPDVEARMRLGEEVPVRVTGRVGTGVLVGLSDMQGLPLGRVFFVRFDPMGWKVAVVETLIEPLDNLAKER